jgi:hypothetical protein
MVTDALPHTAVIFFAEGRASLKPAVLIMPEND